MTGPPLRIGPAERRMIPLSPLMAGAASAVLTGGMSLPVFVGGTALGRVAGMAADRLRERYGAQRTLDPRVPAVADATAVRRAQPRRPPTLADALGSLVAERRSGRATTEVDVGTPRGGTAAMSGAQLREVVHGPRPTTVDPAGGDFPSALRFVLNQEVPIQDRPYPGRTLQEVGPEGDAGIDPPALREFERRNPETWREIDQRLGENFLDAFGGTPHTQAQMPPEERSRRRSVWKAGNANAARSVYADIWNASGADQLPEPLATAHFDAAVQFGPGVARQFLRQSGGDVTKYLDLREARYLDLMTGPGARTPRGRFNEVPAQQHGWLKQRMPALRALVRRRAPTPEPAPPAP